jgi:diacylglycerol kinase (ATP)
MPALVIVNPVAGNGRARRAASRLAAACHAAGATLSTTSAPGHAAELAAAAAAAGFGRVIAVGGEGTIQEVANGLLGAAAAMPLGIVPGGNGNDLARALGLPRDPLAALALALHGAPRPMDVGIARGGGRDRAFVDAAGIGFDAGIAARMAGARAWWQRGRPGYLLTTLDELRRYRNARVRIVLDGGEPTEHRILFAAIANGAWYGGGMQIAPGATVDDGALDVCLVGDLSRFAALGQLPGLYRGAHVRHPAVTTMHVRSIELASIDDDVPVHLDGEPFGSLPLRIEVRPAALQVVMPAPSATVLP